MAEAPAPGVQFPQPSVNPPQVPQVLQAPQAPQAMNPPARAAGQIAPAPQLVQVNVANAQDELEINFGISVSLSILDFLVVSLFWSHYGSGYHLCCVPASVLHGRITFVSSPVSMALLHIKGGVSFPRDKIVSCTRGGFRSIFIVGGTFNLFPFVLSLLLGCWPLYCIFSLWCRSHVGMRLRLTFWLFYVALFFAEFV